MYKNKEKKMGLNARDIQLHLFKVLHLSIEKSYILMKKHPKVSCALLVFLILYIFLSCIYNLLVFLSPFLVFTAILVRIFWSSEQAPIIQVEKNKDEKRVEAKNVPKPIKNERYGKLYKFPSQNATSRRRNFTGKKLDVYGDLEQKAKNLSAVFRNEFTKKNSEIRSGVRFFEKETSPYGYKFEDPKKKALFSESSTVDRVTCDASNHDGKEKRIEKMEDDRKVIKDSSISPNKGVELKEDGQKKLMDLGICEMESKKRLESLIARRMARKQLKLEIEKGLIDIKSISPSQIAPLLISRNNTFDSPRCFDGIEMPGSAPSALRSPFDIPYEPFEEKPNLKGDSFDQEFISDMPLEPRQDLEFRENRIPNSRARRLSGLGIHERSEKLNSKEGSEFHAPNPSYEGNETTYEEEEKCKNDMNIMKSEEVDNSIPTNSILDYASDPNLIPTNIEKVMNPSTNPQEEVLDFPLSTSNVININDSLYESLSTPIDKNNKENMFLKKGLVCHTPSISLASDLQVEFSEIGSPTLTIDDNHEDIWGTHGVSDHIDEENEDANFMPASSDVRADTPTYDMISDRIFFGSARQTGASQYSSDVLARWKRLMRMMDTRVNHSAHEMLSENIEECNQTDNLQNKAQVMTNVNNSETTEQENTNDIRSNDQDPGPSIVRQEVTDEVSTISSSSTSSASSPRSVLPIQQKTVADQETHQSIQQSDMEDVAQETVNGEGSLESISQNIQPSIDDLNVESHNDDGSEEQHKLAEVPLISPMLEESSSEIHKENEGKSEASLKQEAITQPFINDEVLETSSAQDFEGKHNDLNVNESSKEENYLTSETKQLVKDHIEKEQLEKGDFSEDSSLPKVIEVTTNDDDIFGESNKMNKNEGTDKVSNISDENDP